MGHQIIPNNDKVFIGICGERVDLPDFEASKDAILARCASHVGRVHVARGHRVDRNRDAIVLEFMSDPQKPDWLLFLDSDMTFPSDIVFRLLNWRLPVVGGLYFHRKWHHPLVFKDAGKRLDQWGRMIHTHEFIRDEVHDFLVAAGVPRRDQAVAIERPDRLLQCGAIGTGAMMIHRSVLEAMDGPWFEYAEFAESEDLSFCRKVRAMDLPVYVDLGTICGHLQTVPMGYAQFLSSFNSRGLAATNFTLEEAIEMVADILDHKEAERAMMEYNSELLAKHWDSFKTDKDVRDIDFYRNKKTGELYVLELLHWNSSPLFSRFRESLVGQNEIKALEIGSGIGSLAIQLAAQRCDVTAFEANSVLRRFSRKRLKWIESKDKIHSRIGTIDWKASFKRGAMMPANIGSYDLVVAIDVLEHMDEEELWSAVQYIGSYLKPGGKLFAHNAWGDKTGVHPFHYDHSEVWPDMIREVGMFRTSDLWYMKELED